MKKFIITGATSFIGIHLINELIKDDVKIYAVVRQNSTKVKILPQSEKIVILELNMDAYSELHLEIKEPCDCYIGLAWNGTRGTDRDNKARQMQNYINSMNALHSILKVGCSKVISAGSQAEYGMKSSIVTEQEIEVPVTEYGKFKLKYYNEAHDLCKKNYVNFIEPRFFSLYGSDDYGSMIITTLIKMMKNETCDLTLCEQRWDFMHIDDAVEALALLINNKCGDGVYNFGSGINRPLKDYIQIMHELASSHSKLNFGTIPYPSSGVVNVMPDVSKLQNEINFKSKISFENGIKYIINKIVSEEDI